MIEITPKIFAPTFLSFVIRRFKGGSGISMKTFLHAFLIAIILCFMALTLGKHELASKSILERMTGAIIASLCFFGLIFLIMVPAAFVFIWPNRWIYDHNKITVIKRFSNSTLSYNHLDRIIIDSRYCANLRFKDPNSTGLKTTSWFGTSKVDWFNFIEYLNMCGANANGKIWIFYKDGFNMIERKMSSPEEAYDFVEKMFPKLTFEHLNNKIT